MAAMEHTEELVQLFARLGTRKKDICRTELITVDVARSANLDIGSDIYTSKGPVRKPVASSNASFSPYARHDQVFGKNSLKVVDVDHFELPEINEDRERGLLYFVAKKKCGDSFVAVNSDVRIVLDDVARRLALFVPTDRLDASKIAISSSTSTSMSLPTLVQLSPFSSKLLQLELSVFSCNDELVIDEQMVSLCPFEGCSALQPIIEAGDPREMYEAQVAVSKKSLEELCCPVSVNGDTLLMALCGQTKKDTPSVNEAKIVALLKRLLWSFSWSEICVKNTRGTTALEYACVSNKHRIVRLLMELSFLLGGDMLVKDANANNILHLMARKGDKVVDTLEVMLQLKFPNGRKVMSSMMTNRKGELPLHIVCMNNEYHERTIEVLLSAMRSEYSGRLDALLTNNGSSLLIVACQCSSDPELMHFLLRTCGDTLVNFARDDGLAPLHIVAARGEEEYRQVGLRPLAEETQLEMVKLLLEYGADRRKTVEGYYAFNLVRPDRPRVRRLLRLERHGSSSSSVSSSSSKASPNPSLTAIDNCQYEDDFDTIISDLCKHPIIQQALESASAGNNISGDYKYQNCDGTMRTTPV